MGLEESGGDALTNLPWSVALYDEAAGWIVDHDVRAICLSPAGLADVVMQYGQASAQLVFREIAHRVNRLMTSRDRLGRYHDSILLILTTREHEEIEDLLVEIRTQVESIAMDLHGRALLRPQVGIAGEARVTDPAQARPTIETLVASAERAMPAPPMPTPPMSTPPTHQTLEVSEMPQHDDMPAPQPASTEEHEEAPIGREAVIQERIVLEAVQMNLSGHVATAVVRLRERGRRVSSRSVGRNVEQRRLHLLGDAAARALTELLPLGYGAVLSDIQAVSTEVGDAIVAAVTILAPDGEQVLIGVARTEMGVAEAAVRAVLDAVNRRLAFVFADAPLISMN